MNDGITVVDGENQTTKEELISRLSKRLADAEGKAAFCRSKIERNSAYLGDVHADLASATAEADVTRQVLNNIL